MKMVMEGESYNGLIVVEEMWWKLQKEFWELFQMKIYMLPKSQKSS